MDGDAAGLAGLNGPAGLNGLAEQNAGGPPPMWDRYAHWPRPAARLALGLLILFCLLAAWAPGMPAPPAAAPNVQSSPIPAVPKSVPSEQDDEAAQGDAKDNDLRLYRLIDDRLERGDNYYVAATELQRQSDYPVAPGLTVRLPTLAWLTVWLGPDGVLAAQIALLGALIFSLFKRFGIEPGGMRYRRLAIVLLFVGLSNAIHFPYLVIHEVWAGQLMALSFGLHRPDQGRWHGAWLAAAAAVAIRELALPFVLLMAAGALWRRQWREAAAWVLLVCLFIAGLLVHLHLAEAQIRPGDQVSPSWLVFGGLPGWLYKVIHSSVLSALPEVIAGPLVILAVFGWTGWRSPAGNFAALLTLGYGLSFMIAGRDNNFYWGVIITPILFMGMALLPLALPSLYRRALR